MTDKLPTVSTEVYEIEGEIARGGLGRILRAKHRAMGRTVAVKELLPGGASEARFVEEALITGRLEHPAIVPVYDAGRWPSGEPFYTMKLVSGRSLQGIIKSAKTLEARIALVPNVIAVAEAIAYAHSKRVIHRDIKPANVIVGSFGETVVIDWGVAKDLEAPDEGSHTVVGTPAYMPPEQARGDRVDERADVYALGALLYHVLAGVAPYGRPGAEVASRDPTRVVNTPDTPEADEVARLLDEVSSGPAQPLEARQPGVPLELLTIVHKAMARDPADRYPSARELAEDLRRFQTGKLVSAHHYTPWQLARRFLSRYRAVVAVGAAAALALAAVGALSIARIVQSRQVAEQGRAEAHEARLRAEKRENELILLRARALVDADPTGALAGLKQYPPEATHWDEARRIASRAVGRGVARDLFRGHKGTVRTIAFSPDGETLASGGVDRTIRLWDVKRRHPCVILRGHDGIVTDVAFSPDGKYLASTGFDRRALLWDLATGTSRPIGVHDDGVRAVAFAPDGKTLATAGFNQRLILWNLAGEQLKVLEGHLSSPLIVDFSPDGKTLFSAAEDDTIRLWDLKTGEAKILPNRSWATFAHDGKTIAAGFDGEVRLYDLAHGTSRSVKVPGLARPFAFSPDGRTLATTSLDTVRMIDIASGRLRTLSGHSSDVYDAVFSPDGRLLATAGLDGTVRLWALPPPEGQILRGLDAGADIVAFSPDGKHVVGAGRGGIAVWDLPAGSPPRLLPGVKEGTKYLGFVPDGSLLISAGTDRQVRAWDVAAGTARVLATTTYLPRPIAMAAKQPLMAVSDGFEQMRLISWADGSERCRVTGKNLVIAAFAAGDTTLYFGNGERLARLDVESCAERPVADHGGGWITDLNLVGATLAYATKFGRIGVIHLPAGTPRHFADDAYETRSVALSPDGSTMAAGSDLRITLWDTARGVRLRELTGHDSPIEWVAFTPDSQFLVSRSADELRVWRPLADGDRVYRGHDARITSAAIAPDGKTVASSSADGTIRLWPAETDDGLPTDAAGLRAWLDATTNVILDAEDRAVSPVPRAP